VELAPGVEIGGRYRIQGRAWDAGNGAVWLAFDAVLERSVLVQTFPGVEPSELATSVARAARISHPGLSQIYDMSSEPPGIVFENAPGGRLADRKDGAMSPAHAAALCTKLAAAIAALHDHGSAHGAIEPRTVLLDEEGRPKLCAAMPEHNGDGDPTYRPPDPGAGGEERDRYALGAIAYRLFTGREPGPDAPPARTARRGIPPHVDALLSRALARDPAARPTVAEFRRVLEPLATEEPPERGPGFFRQESSWLVPVLLVIAIGIAAIAFGVQKVVQKANNNDESPGPAASAAAFPVIAVKDFDPLGNKEEHPRQVGAVIDGKASAWSTLGYRTAALGGEKKGVGLVFDLGETRIVGRIEVQTPQSGWQAEWRVADSEGATPDDFRVVNSFTAGGDPIAFSSPVRARYWVLWITRLVDSESGGPYPFLAQVSEVTFLPR
jgi:hypothetical protein